MTDADLAPLVAFELNIVGPQNAEISVLSSGAGTITYTTNSPSGLTALSQEPSCTESGLITEEEANTCYGVLPEIEFKPRITQSFRLST